VERDLALGLGPELHGRSWRPDLGLPFAKIMLIERALARGELEQVRFAWLGQLTHASHNIVVREITQEGSGRWWYPLGQVGNSMVVMWPATEHQVRHGGKSHDYFDPATEDYNLRELFPCVWDLSAWEARRIRWRSPLWQFVNLGEAGGPAVSGGLGSTLLDSTASSRSDAPTC
jgi:hypothetical protein